MRYRPEYPSEVTVEWLWRELQRISQTMEQIQDGHLELTSVEPEKPRDGDIRYADGVNWQPPNGIEGKQLVLWDGTKWRPFG